MKRMASLDRYTIRARLAPALLVALPIAVATFAWLPDGVRASGAVWALIAWAGGTTLLAQIGRDAGRRKERLLFERWGGKPTTRMLRHRETQHTILERRHKKLKTLMRSVKIPSAAEEAADPGAADAVYEACSAFLRERTRDHKKFALVFEENCNYGFRRNLWGMKPVGLLITLASVIAIAAVPVFDAAARTGERLAVVGIGGGVNSLLLVGWLFVFTPAWVKVPADAYAERLLEASELL